MTSWNGFYDQKHQKQKKNRDSLHRSKDTCNDVLERNLRYDVTKMTSQRHQRTPSSDVIYTILTRTNI